MRRMVRLLFTLALLGLSSCVTLAGDDWHGIAPSEFHFIPIVALRGKETGGWKVARVVITLVWKSGSETRSAVCQVQVEVPERNYSGLITNEFAQMAAAEAADTAAQRVLSQGLLSAQMCARFNAELEAALSIPIPGCRVSSFHERSRNKPLK